MDHSDGAPGLEKGQMRCPESDFRLQRQDDDNNDLRPLADLRRRKVVVHRR